MNRSPLNNIRKKILVGIWGKKDEGSNVKRRRGGI